MNGQTDAGSEDKCKNNRRHIFHKDNWADTHSHGAKSENHIQISDDPLADKISGKKADKATQEDA